MRLSAHKINSPILQNEVFQDLGFKKVYITRSTRLGYTSEFW